jgi:hypothetical protein
MVSAGSVAEWSIAPVLKTGDGQPSVSSNLTASAKDRDAQFSHIARTVAEYQAAGDPVISVDTKKKELIGDFKNGGKEWQPKGKPEEVRVHDFIDRELGKVAPYGVYDSGQSHECQRREPSKIVVYPQGVTKGLFTALGFV